ncbi:unnamed protein product [Cylicocyclus nassatus]|uniref:RNA-directed RNA polymerase n=1 Tax=Cylicocyclus nassatus TaxID=53992 RepID=A0AA36M326_CYLNA|nr:unnamed protein product [Cylicocyclus nassatus]
MRVKDPANQSRELQFCRYCVYAARTVMAVARLKLQIPNPDGDLFTSERGKLIIGHFHQILDQFKFKFDLPISLDVREYGEQVRIEIYEIKPCSRSTKWLLAIFEYFAILKNKKLKIYPSVIVHSPQLFSTKIRSSHQRSLGAIYFGNLQRGIFINHWEVSFKRENTNNRIWADFLYDENDLLCITFANPEEDYPSLPSGQHSTELANGIANYKLQVRLSSVSRIMIEGPSPCDPLRIYFELRYPVIVRRSFQVRGQRNKGYTRYLEIRRGRTANDIPDVKALTDSPVFMIEFYPLPKLPLFYEILSRLRMRTGLGIEISHFSMRNYLYFKDDCPYARWVPSNLDRNAATSQDDDIFDEFLDRTIKMKDLYDANKYAVRPEWVTDVFRERRFSLIFLIELLISKGAVVKDQLLLDKESWCRFLMVVNDCYLRDREVCLSSLERIATMIDERGKLDSIRWALLNEFEDECRHGYTMQLSKEEIKRGYRRVRKIVVTPSRIIYVPPETLMPNRVIRKYDHDGARILRVTFRDDDNQPMRPSKTSELLIEETLRKVLREGIVVAGRNFGYLGNSNSQMRDRGAYFMEKYSRHQFFEYLNKHKLSPEPTWQPRVDQVREELGDFLKMENVYKLMARLGQCFTQSRESGAIFQRSEYFAVPDVIGGRNSLNESYKFSDGVGMLSMAFATEIARDMMLGKCVPSCYQFRFRGFKGVMAVNPFLDEIAQWADTNNIREPNMFGCERWLVKMIFRESQQKFVTKRKEKEAIEIVKYSSPSPVALNKPFICILNQTSKLQSRESHERITNRIEQFAEEQLRGFARSLLYEKECRNKLKELPQRICIDRLPLHAGFSLSTEPFFRSLVRAMATFYIVKQMRKQQFPIPFDKGRTMLGVIDDTGQLQYGQVFVQYTEHRHLKTPPPQASKKVLTGKVMLTKSPCIVPGDVRVFNAVDIPDLHHLCDVVVFPQHGPRPLTDQMAGSDLDGDEFAVIWDKELMLDRNEEAFDYTSEKPVYKPVKKGTISEDMVDVYVNYVMHDSIGTIGNAFQFQADLYGITSKVCLSLAKKHSQAVDFSKTGRPPSRLTENWSSDGTPPEKPERQPDFHITNEIGKPIYHSKNLLGSVCRGIRVVDDILRSPEASVDDQIELDKYITIDGWEKDEQIAMRELMRYNGLLRGLLENYGIKSEAEAFTGCITEMRNRISDRDQDDMSYFTTNEVIENRIANLFRKFRENFFAEFGGWQSCLKHATTPYANNDDVLDYYITCPSLSMKRKAVAYYRTCYDLARGSEERLLSFAWLAYDVLAVVKQHNIICDEDYYPPTCPVLDVLESRLELFYLDNLEKIEALMGQLSETKTQLYRYLRYYPGLEQIFYVLVSWARCNQLLNGCIQAEHMCVVLVLFATGRIAGSISIMPPVLDTLSAATIEEDDIIKPTTEQYINMLILFYEYMASRYFKNLTQLSFAELGCDSVFLRGQWLPVHEAAANTYYNLVLNMDFEGLFDPLQGFLSTSGSCQECEPFIIELPVDSSLGALEERIKKKTGVTGLSLRRSASHYYKTRVAVCARGTTYSLRLLRKLLIVTPPQAILDHASKISELLPTLLYKKIMD